MQVTKEDIRKRLELVAVVRTPKGQWEDAIVGFDGESVIVKSTKPKTKPRPIRFDQILSFRGTSHSRIRLALACVVGVPGAWEELQRDRAK